MGTLKRQLNRVWTFIKAKIKALFSRNKGNSQPQTYHKIENQSTGIRANRLITGYAWNPQAVYIPRRRKLKGYQKQHLTSFNKNK